MAPPSPCAPRFGSVTPAFDEAESRPNRLPRLVSTLEGLADAGEVVVVDDGSRDGTADGVEALALPGVRVERMRMNRGKSAALRRGLGVAKGDVIVLMDADGQDDPSELPRLLEIGRASCRERGCQYV